MAISDDFSSDTSANYTAIGGGITVTSGAAHGSSSWANNYVYHETSLGSADQIVQATVNFNGTSDGGAIIARWNTGTSTGYVLNFNAGQLKLFSLSGSTPTYIQLYGSYSSGTYVLKLEIVGTAIKCSVDGVVRIDTTDTTYSTGDYCGIAMLRGVANYDATVDDLTAVASIELEGFRFRNDDGSESAATWKASQDTNITLPADTAARIRALLNATGDPASKNFQLEYRYKPSGGAFGSWTKVR